MKTRTDNWCPTCFDWMPFDDDGNCIKCKTFINKKATSHKWTELYGVSNKELEQNSLDA